MDLLRGVDIAGQLCRTFEGFSAKPYLDPVGIPTQGYGSTHRSDGTPIYLTDQPISQPIGMAWLMDGLEHLVAPVLALCPGIDTDERLGAVLSWSYNLGTRRLRASTMRARINDQDWPGAKIEMQRWTRAGGRILHGLVFRRAVESALL